MHRGAIVILAAALLAPATARAGLTITDGDSAFHLDVYTWDGRACVVTPEAQQGQDAGACVASDRASVAPALALDGGAVLQAAVVHFDGWDLRVLGDRIDVDTSSLEGLDDDAVIARSKRALQGALPPGARLASDGLDGRTEVKRANGVPFVRVTPAIEGASPAGAGVAAATVAYVVASTRGMYVLSFSSDPAHAADVARVADNAINSLIASPPDRANGKPGFGVGFVLASLLAIGVLVGLGLLVGAGVRALRREDV